MGSTPAGAASGPPPALASPDDVLEAVHAVMHRVRSLQHQALRDGELDLGPMEARVLGYFARHPGATQRDLAEHSGRDKGQLARLVNGLRERGLLDASPDAADRRVTRLHLTDHARQLHQAVQRQRRRLAERAAAGLSEAERQQLLALLARLQHNLDGAA